MREALQHTYKLQQQYTTLIVIIKTALQQIIFTLSYVYVLIWCESAMYKASFFLENLIKYEIVLQKNRHDLVYGFAYDLQEKSIRYSYWRGYNGK